MMLAILKLILYLLGSKATVEEECWSWIATVSRLTLDDFRERAGS